MPCSVFSCYGEQCKYVAGETLAKNSLLLVLLRFCKKLIWKRFPCKHRRKIACRGSFILVSHWTHVMSFFNAVIVKSLPAIFFSLVTKPSQSHTRNNFRKQRRCLSLCLCITFFFISLAFNFSSWSYLYGQADSSSSF